MKFFGSLVADLGKNLSRKEVSCSTSLYSFTTKTQFRWVHSVWAKDTLPKSFEKEKIFRKFCQINFVKNYIRNIESAVYSFCYPFSDVIVENTSLARCASFNHTSSSDEINNEKLMVLRYN